MSKIESMNDLLEDNLKDLYSAEKQLTKALPKLSKAATSPELKEAIELHLQETEMQITRLEQIAELTGMKLSGKKCKAMEGLVKEGSEAAQMEGDEALIDAAIIVASQKVEHYEISGYGSAKALAEQLGLKDVVELLDETLTEESSTDKKLTSLCQQVVFSRYEGSESPRSVHG